MKVVGWFAAVLTIAVVAFVIVVLRHENSNDEQFQHECDVVGGHTITSDGPYGETFCLSGDGRILDVR